MPAQMVTKDPRGMRGPTGDPAGAPKRKRRKAPVWATTLTVFGAVLALLGLSGAVGVRYFLGQLTENIQTTSSVLDESNGGTAATGKLPDGAMNLLMLGLEIGRASRRERVCWIV